MQSAAFFKNSGNREKQRVKKYNITALFKTKQADLATEREHQLTQESTQKGLNMTFGAQFAALPLVRPVV